MKNYQSILLGSFLCLFFQYQVQAQTWMTFPTGTVSGTGIGITSAGTGNPFKLMADNTSQIQFFTGGTSNTTSLQRMTIDQNGNVGIGIATATLPADKLHIASGVLRVVGTDMSAIVSSSALRIGNYGDSYSWIQSNATSGNASPLLLNPKGGKVGIGTSSPQALLNIDGTGFNGTNDQTLRIGSAGNGPGASCIDMGILYNASPTTTPFQYVLTATTTSNSVFSIGSVGHKYMNFTTQGVERMFILKDGTVGIGQQSDFVKGFPSAFGLFVSKGILSERVKCAVKSTTNWSDHVFAKDYYLPSIEEMDLFIKTHKHLPGVPSAEQMVKNGLDVAEMDAKLLEKIEELALYVIELKKENEKMKKDMERMAKRK